MLNKMNTVMMIVFGASIFFWAAVGSSSGTGSALKLPSGFHKCKWDNPKLNECILKGLSAGLSQLVKGVPEYDLPSIDPLNAGIVIVDQSSNPKIRLTQFFNNQMIQGLSSISISDLKFNKNERKFELKYTASRPIKLDGSYNVTGKILTLPITGHGQNHFVLRGFHGRCKGEFTPLEKNDEMFWKIKDVDLDFNVTKVEIRLDNLFNGDKVLGDNMNLFMNENWALIYEDMKPAFKIAIKRIYIDYIQRFIERINIKEAFPQ